jgi:S-formylglutathione hydrolase FrmB
MSTPALDFPVKVRILLPTGYRDDPRRRYPVLYLLHGASGNAADWTSAAKGQAEQLTAGKPLIVVMPDGGTSDQYADWFASGSHGLRHWETFHIDELIPWVDRHLRTRARRSQRAIAGLSMGGGGAMTYAALHPELFAAAASFSGQVDTSFAGSVALIEGSGVQIGGPGASVYGPRATQEIRWRGHNALDLAENLAGLTLDVRTGDGQPGGPDGSTFVDPIETAVHVESTSLHRRLARLRIAHVWDDYGAGGHRWFDWRRDLVRTLPRLLTTFAHPRPLPRRITYTSIRARYDQYGWSVRLVRPVLAFSTLSRAGRTGFALTGSGAATVRTPRLFGARRRVRVRVRDVRGTHTRTLRAGRDGRLRVALSLGRADRRQQDTPGAKTAERTGRVTLRALK